jgi:hypothetical protein
MYRDKGGDTLVSFQHTNSFGGVENIPSLSLSLLVNRQMEMNFFSLHTKTLRAPLKIT